MLELKIQKSKVEYYLIEHSKDDQDFIFSYTSEKGHEHIFEGSFSYEFNEEEAEDETGFDGSVDYEVDVDLLVLVDEYENRRIIESFYFKAIIEDALKEALENTHEFEYC
jgi:hypothetical protein